MTEISQWSGRPIIIILQFNHLKYWHWQWAIFCLFYSLRCFYVKYVILYYIYYFHTCFYTLLALHPMNYINIITIDYWNCKKYLCEYKQLQVDNLPANQINNAFDIEITIYLMLFWKILLIIFFFRYFWKGHRNCFIYIMPSAEFCTDFVRNDGIFHCLNE